MKAPLFEMSDQEVKSFGIPINDIVKVQPTADYSPLLMYRRTTMHHGATMEMTFKVEELLGILRANLKDHKKIIKEAKAGYKKAIIAECKAKLDAAKKGEDFDKHFKSTLPGDHSRDYERTIKMLEMTVDEELDLTGDQFECYVMDRWQWQESFLATTSAYSNFANVKMSQY